MNKGGVLPSFRQYVDPQQEVWGAQNRNFGCMRYPAGYNLFEHVVQEARKTKFSIVTNIWQDEFRKLKLPPVVSIAVETFIEYLMII